MRKPTPQDLSVSIPAPGEDKRGEDGHIGYLLRQAAGIFRLKLERQLADLDVTPPQFLVLTMIVAYPGISNADLARLTLLTPQTVTVIVANLEKAGLLVRTPHAIHGRIQHIEATTDGMNRLADCRRKTKILEDSVVAGLTSEEEKIVRKWLVGIATST